MFGVCLEDVGDLVDCVSSSCLFCPRVDAAVLLGDGVGDFAEGFGGVLV